MREVATIGQDLPGISCSCVSGVALWQCPVVGGVVCLRREG
jgi:hypothetical protein